MESQRLPGFKIEDTPEVEIKKPTRPQLRFLHALSQNILEIKSRPVQTCWLKSPSGDYILWNFHPVVANNVVINGWAELKKLSTHKAEYHISDHGKEVLKYLCEHKHVFEDSTEIVAGNLICKECARSIRCRSKQPTAHGANRWHFRFGPICQPCWDYLYPPKNLKTL